MNMHLPANDQQIELDPHRPKWEMQVGETTKAFQYFDLWLQLGTERSIEKLRRIQQERLGEGVGSALHSKKKYAKGSVPNGQTLGIWHKLYRWEERAAAWAQFQADIARQQQIDDTKAMLSRHADACLALTELTLGEMAKWMTKAADPKNKDKPIMSVEEIRRTLDTLVKIERLSRGVPSEITENQQTGTGGAAFEDMPRHKRQELFERYTAGRGPAADGPGYVRATEEERAIAFNESGQVDEDEEDDDEEKTFSPLPPRPQNGSRKPLPAQPQPPAQKVDGRTLRQQPPQRNGPSINDILAGGFDNYQ